MAVAIDRWCGVLEYGNHVFRADFHSPRVFARSVMPWYPLDRLLIALWLAASPHSWQRTFLANDTPHVYATGENRDHVLLTGDGAATGRGVLSHDLGLPGYLARSLSARTGHATDVDIVVDQLMTARTCLPAIKDVDLSRFDLILLSVGHNEALALVSAVQWEEDLETLFSDIEARTSPETKIVILSIPTFAEKTQLPRLLARVVDQHAVALNAVISTLISARSNMTMMPLSGDNQFEAENAHVYARWAEGIATRITGIPDARRRTADRWTFHEAARQRAVENLGELVSSVDPVLDQLTELARHTFGAPMAVITIVRSETQVMKAVSGMEPIVVAREQSFCDTTIRRASQLVVEDTQADPRFADFDAVVGPPGVRFYAGAPIESPQGYRVGALCIMDTEPRRFTAGDLKMLRNLALIAQEQLWRPDLT
ncbi:GAF domain-containing protein [Microbacterium sp. P02]|uniref:GAF domain-containing protein n=1 Tax=Microbacterium sp. P02 TaxID=3366260 RepID=UPI00366C5651